MRAARVRTNASSDVGTPDKEIVTENRPRRRFLPRRESREMGLRPPGDRSIEIRVVNVSFLDHLKYVPGVGFQLQYSTRSTGKLVLISTVSGRRASGRPGVS